MKHIFIAITIFISGSVLSQTTTSDKLIDLISKADTVNFIADNSGCFHAYVLEIKMCKQKSGNRKLIMKTDTGIVQKSLSVKKYRAFIEKYKASTNYFVKNSKQTCTSVTEFDLYCRTKTGSTNGSKFKNLNCNAEYNPEFFLQDLLRANTTNKK